MTYTDIIMRLRLRKYELKGSSLQANYYDYEEHTIWYRFDMLIDKDYNKNRIYLN